MSSTKLIDLAGFRRRTGLTQAKLAEFLGVTRGNISLMESAGRISPQHIDKVYREHSSCGLIPCYDRLIDAEVYLVKNDYLESHFLNLDVLPFVEQLTAEVVLSIKYGKVGITSDMANKIVTSYPIINKEWLISGEGDMVVRSLPIDWDTRLTAIENTQKEILSRLYTIISMMKIE